MLYYSTNRNTNLVDFKQATIQGLAPDNGLYFPKEKVSVPTQFFSDFKNLSNAEIAFEVIKPYVGECIPESDLFKICSETVNFEIPLKQLEEKIFVLELFHGPTLAFKDIGARFMSRCLGYFSKDFNRKMVVLVATSGDTGSAVANGFLDVEGVEVVILYPSGKVSKVQELQLTTLGKNIKALEVNGNFDDCQTLVKQAFLDNDLNRTLFLTSANSINIARWLPQQFYYFFALKQWTKKDAPVICVPSGNFGNICAGLQANLSGLPVKHFIAACNSNKVFTNYLQTGIYEPQKVTPTISNAMDVGNPSNFVRILEQFEKNHKKIHQTITSYSVTDEQTRKTIYDVFTTKNYLTDPHGAVAYYALNQYLKNNPKSSGIFLETAHPVKFDNIVQEVTGQTIVAPDSVKNLYEKKKNSIVINSDFSALKEFLMNC